MGYWAASLLVTWFKGHVLCRGGQGRECVFGGGEIHAESQRGARTERGGVHHIGLAACEAAIATGCHHIE